MGEQVPSKELVNLYEATRTFRDQHYFREHREPEPADYFRAGASWERTAHEPPVSEKLPPLPKVDGYDRRVEGHYSATSMLEYGAMCAINERRKRAAQPPPADEQIDQTIRLIEECELSMDDSEGLVAMLTELKQRRAAQPPAAEPGFKVGDRVEWTNLLNNTFSGRVTEVRSEPRYIVQFDDRTVHQLAEGELRAPATKRTGRCPHGYEFANLDDGTDTCSGCSPEGEGANDAT